LEIKWSNETTVADILNGLEEKCKDYKFLKRKVCDKVVETLVKIPPQIFAGLETLAWDIPLGTCATLHQCKMECCDEGAAPEQLHLSLASKDRSLMGITWVTLNSNESVVQYGLNADDLSNIAIGEINTYKQAGWIGNIHRAMMSKLEPAQVYYYRVGNPSTNLWSEVFSFRTFDPSASSVKYAVLADMGYGSASDDTVKQLEQLVNQNKLDVVIHSGDVSYADGFETHWDTYFNKIQNIAARVPYMVTPGNHEFWYNFAAYKARFLMPSVGSNVDSDSKTGSGDNMWYSWEYGNTHFEAMNSETALDTAKFHKDELDYANNDLASVDRSQTPFVITHFHRPLYCSNDGECTNNNNGDKVNKLTEEGEELFNSNKVDLCLTGHVHEYERTYPVYQSKVVTKSFDNDGTSPFAPIYIVQGASGNREGNKGGFADEASGKLPEWHAGGSVEVGYGLLDVDSAITAANNKGLNTLRWNYYRSSDNELLDNFTLTKK